MAVPIIIYFELWNGLLKEGGGCTQFIAGPAITLRNGHNICISQWVLSSTFYSIWIALNWECRALWLGEAAPLIWTRQATG